MVAQLLRFEIFVSSRGSLSFLLVGDSTWYDRRTYHTWTNADFSAACRERTEASRVVPSRKFPTSFTDRRERKIYITGYRRGIMTRIVRRNGDKKLGGRWTAIVRFATSRAE